MLAQNAWKIALNDVKGRVTKTDPKTGRRSDDMVQEVIRHDAAAMGAGELAMPSRSCGTGVLPFPFNPLFSLMALLSSLTLVSIDPVESLLTSSEKGVDRSGAVYLGTDHTTPVNDLNFNPYHN